MTQAVLDPIESDDQGDLTAGEHDEPPDPERGLRPQRLIGGAQAAQAVTLVLAMIAGLGIPLAVVVIGQWLFPG